MAEIARGPAAELLAETRQRLGPLARRLRSFLEGSEHVFLETGSRLQSFGDRAGKLLGTAASAVVRVCDDGTEGRAFTLAQELGRMRQYLDASRDGSSAAAERLHRVVEAVSGLDAFRGSFQRTVKSLRALGICTSIESSRAGAQKAGFETVAEDVRRLGGTMEAGFAAVLTHTSELRATASSALERTRGFAAWQRSSSSEALERAEDALARLQQLSTAAVGVGARAQTSGGQISSILRNVLTSLQFHDIVRQMVEHVIEAVEGCAGLEPPDGDGEQTDALLAETAETCHIQASQLRRAREELSRALEQTAASLAEIAGCVGSVTAETRTIGGEEEDGLVPEVARGVSAAAEALREHASYKTQTSAAMRSVGRTVEEMTRSVLDIEDIGAEVELIAVNALIKSTKTGVEGRALAVLAQEIQKLSVEARRRTSAVTAALRVVTSETQALDSATPGEQIDADAILGKLEGLVEGLGAFHRAMLGSVGELAADTDALASEVDELYRRLHAAAEAAQELEGVERELGELGRRAQARVQTAGDRPAGALSRAAEERYTMESERLVHRTAVGAGPVGGERASPGPGAELGDNVELF